jgi:Core-2/I-Branching enzyme
MATFFKAFVLMPKIAYFIMVHNKPEQFAWLMQAIANPHDLFFVHVDLKSRLGIKADRRGVMAAVHKALAGVPNVYILPSRFTNWGGWSLSRILLDTIKLALVQDPTWTHFINLSGQCYPLKSIDEIRGQLARSDGAVHAEMLPIAELPDDDWHRRSIRMFETPLRAHILKGAQPGPASFVMRHKGSQWVMLPRDLCAWIGISPVTSDVSRYLSRRLLSDELIVQTLVANSPFRDRLAPSYGRAILWPGPKVLTIADCDWLKDSDALFGRKFDSAQDMEVMENLARHIGSIRPSPHTG